MLKSLTTSFLLGLLTVAASAGATATEKPPGLIDMHVHMVRRPLDTDPEEWRFPNYRELNERFGLLFVANGVTSVRQLHAHPVGDELRALSMGDSWLGPAIYSTGPITDGDPPVWPIARIVKTPAEARQAVADDKAAGYLAIKVYDHISLQTYDAITAAAAQVHLDVVGHVPRDVGLRRAIDAHQATIEHTDSFLDSLQPGNDPYVSRPQVFPGTMPELGAATSFPLGSLDVPGIWYSGIDENRYYIIYTTGSFGIAVNSATSHGNLVASSLTIADVPVPALSLACPSGTAPEGIPYNSTLTATGGLPPYTFSIGTGLPQGLLLNTSTGAISGTPAGNGAFTFNAQVVDSLGTDGDTVSSSCAITVAPAPPAVALLADLLADVQEIGSDKSLATEVQLAQTYYAAHDVPATCAVLTALVEDVKALAEKKRGKTHRGDIIRDARATQHVIGCFAEDGRSCRDSHHHDERERDDHHCHQRERTE